MKKNIILLMTAVFGVFVLAGCSEDDLKKTSAVLDSPTVENDFDRWLAKNYLEPYNIDFKYRFKDVLGDMDYNLTPADYGQAIKLAKLMLKMYLSIPEDVEIDVVGELDALRDDVLAGTDGLTTDVSENTDLRSLELQEEVLRRSLKAANAGRMPTLAAFGTVSYTGNDMEPFSFGGMTDADNSKYFWTHPISVGLQLSVPIFSGLTKMNKSRELKNQIAQLSLQRDYARQQIDVQVRSALNDLLTARETMYAQELTVEQARKAYKISDTRYRAGAGTILELNSAQLSQTQAQLNFSQSIYDYLSAKAEYDRIVGRENQ